MRDFLGAFEAFKEANDDRLAEIEAKQSADVLTVEKVDRINDALDRQQSQLEKMSLKAARPELGGSAAPFNEHKHAFDRYVRAGDAGAIHRLEEKSLSAGTPADGGYLAPEETERLVTARMKDLSPVRQIASVREIGANTFRKPVSLAGATPAGWVAETGARAETDSPTLSPIDFPTMELYAMPAATQTLLDDAIVDIEQWLADEVQAEFAAQEGDAFINGNGATQPKGILSYTINPDASYVWGELGYIATGVDGALPASHPSDVLIDLIYTVKQSYRANGRFVMNRSTVRTIRKLKDGDDNYIWQPAQQAGAAPTLAGYPVTEAEDMPSIGSGAHAIAFGDFARGYLIVDRVGVRVLRDPFSAKPYVLFYTTKRVGGGVQDFDAIKLLKFSAS